MDVPEQLPPACLAPHSDVAPTLILCATEAKCDPDNDVRPHVNLAVGVMNVGGRVLYHIYQVSGYYARKKYYRYNVFMYFITEIHLNNLQIPLESPQKITLSSQTTLVILSESQLTRLSVRTDGSKSLHNLLHFLLLQTLLHQNFRPYLIIGTLYLWHPHTRASIKSFQSGDTFLQDFNVWVSRLEQNIYEL